VPAIEVNAPRADRRPVEGDGGQIGVVRDDGEEVLGELPAADRRERVGCQVLRRGIMLPMAGSPSVAPGLD
jgi:hypothetical protein